MSSMIFHQKWHELWLIIFIYSSGVQLIHGYKKLVIFLFRHSNSSQLEFACFVRRFFLFFLIQKIWLILNLDFSEFDILLLTLTQNMSMKKCTVFLADTVLICSHLWNSIAHQFFYSLFNPQRRHALTQINFFHFIFQHMCEQVFLQFHQFH